MAPRLHNPTKALAKSRRRDEDFKPGSAANRVQRQPVDPTKGGSRGEFSAKANMDCSEPEVWLELARWARYRVGRLASIFGFSVRQLERDFTECGMSPQSWLEQVRVWQAARLLEMGEQPKNLPGRLAFGSASGFWRTFRRRLRCTPGNYLACASRRRSRAAERLKSRRSIREPPSCVVRTSAAHEPEGRAGCPQPGARGRGEDIAPYPSRAVHGPYAPPKLEIKAPDEALRVLGSLPTLSRKLRLDLSRYARRLDAQRQSVAGADQVNSTGLAASARATA